MSSRFDWALIRGNPNNSFAAQSSYHTGWANLCALQFLPRGEPAAAAEAAGADFVGAEDLVEKINGGWTDFDVAIATPDMMGQVGRLGRILGPRGLMPNPKSGTVTPDAARAVQEAKAGRVEYRVDKSANVHTPVGKASFDAQRLQENAQVLIDAIVRARPSATKGQYMRSVTLSTTMGPGIRLDRTALAAN